MTETRRAPIIYRLSRTVLASGRVYERGVAGTAEDFGDIFHPLRTAGYLDRLELTQIDGPHESTLARQPRI